MADQQTPSNKRPHGETPSPPSPSKARRLDLPVSPLDSAKGFEDSSLVGPSNSSTTAAVSKSASTAAEHVSKPPVSKPTIPPPIPTPHNISEMSREELMQLHDPIRCAEIERTSYELQKKIEDEIRNMSRAEWEQYCIDSGQEYCKLSSFGLSTTH